MEKHLECGYNYYIVIVSKKHWSLKFLDGLYLIHNNVYTDNAHICHCLEQSNWMDTATVSFVYLDGVQKLQSRRNNASILQGLKIAQIYWPY